MEMWDRQDGETDRAYEAFAIYRDMGVSRSGGRVGAELGKSSTLIDRWRSRWDWVARVALWDRLKDQELRDETEEKRKSMLRKHADLGEKIVRLVDSKLMTYIGDDTPGVELSHKDLATWATTGTLIERKARGEPETGDSGEGQAEIDARRAYEDGILRDPEAREDAFELVERLAGYGQKRRRSESGGPGTSGE